MRSTPSLLIPVSVCAAGWPVTNTQARLFTSAAACINTVLTLIPWPRREWAYAVCALCLTPFVAGKRWEGSLQPCR